MSSVFMLRGVVKNYEWGKLGMESSVAKLYKSSFPDFCIREDNPYAELWIGTHPSGPSLIPSMNETSLSEYVKEHPGSLGDKITGNFNGSGLPFLFKVLSVRKSLSIQVHPDKPTAKELHQKSPNFYPDDNHKPEMAIALTDFQALCGFRPISEIKAFVLELPQLQAVIGNTISSQFLNTNEVGNQLFKTVFTSVITRRPEEFQSHLLDLVQHFKNNASLSDLCKSIKEVFLTVHSEYPGDIGCFCIFFLNYMNLAPGEAMFLAANEPHAYLKGDCIECMACSDNVVRAGLTPKYKDVETLCELLTYKCKTAKDNIYPSTNVENDPCVKIYNPPVPEFAVAKIEVESTQSPYHLSVLDSASVLIVIEGEAVAQDTKENGSQSIMLHYGVILFISVQSQVQIQVKSPKIIMYRAYCA